MQFDLSGATEQSQRMANAFLQRLPHLLVALLVFAAFYLAAKVLRGASQRIFEKRTRHRNVGFVVGETLINELDLQEVEERHAAASRALADGAEAEPRGA